MLAKGVKMPQVLLEVVSVAEARRSDEVAVFRPAPTSAPEKVTGTAALVLAGALSGRRRRGAVDLDDGR